MYLFCSRLCDQREMRFSGEHLKFKALVALDEAAESKVDSVRSFSLRFALADLDAVSGGERWPCDEFWRSAISAPGPTYMTSLARRQSLEAVLRCQSNGSAGGARAAAWCSAQGIGDLSCAMLRSGTVARWDHYWGRRRCS
jgi:hypothetical protein